jgi:hypothetical protein
LFRLIQDGRRKGDAVAIMLCHPLFFGTVSACRRIAIISRIERIDSMLFYVPYNTLSTISFPVPEVDLFLFDQLVAFNLRPENGLPGS